MTSKKAPIAAAILLLGGCATYSGWQPTIDSYNDPNAAMIPQDTEQCKMLAQQAASVGTETAKGAAAGGLLGAAAGAAIGAVAGNPGGGAAIGAAAGGLGGGAQQGLSGDEQYRRAFINCMRNRGHNVIN
ncbi:glycine zipper family protein [Candidatus Methylocalor cossyra]|uniref:Gly-zipper_OmpA domain-containing protein n=1 Tax=Candidatus Methylocalor cossyra TaxID=3108543 RepID=A0ABM9NLA5_9GAMM